MMILLQKEEKRNPMNIECEIVKDAIKHSACRIEYIPVSYNEFFDKGELMKAENYPKYWAKDAIPIGTIEFVEAWMQIFHGHRLNPIEIPPCLQTDDFLKRKYMIATYDKIPKNGAWFVKDASHMKTFSTAGYTSLSQIDIDLLSSDSYAYDKEDKFMMSPINKSHLFQISEYVDIKAEYRAYFIKGTLENLCLYNGDLSLYPDVDLINKANMIYSIQKDYPFSYTMDIMVSDRGTAIIEIHPFASVGLYSTLWSSSLLDAYRHGIEYYIKHNTKIMPTEFKPV